MLDKTAASVKPTYGDLNRAFVEAKIGDELIYHEGLLMVDRLTLDKNERSRLRDLAAWAFATQQRGLGALKQRKIAPGVYQYILEKIKDAVYAD